MIRYQEKIYKILPVDSTKIETVQENLPSSKMTYGHFLEYLDMGWVTKVDFYENGHRSIVETSSPELGNRSQRIQVDIPTGASSQLITKLKTANIDFDLTVTHRKVLCEVLLRRLVFLLLQLF